jgi:hypothetical protein
LCSITRTISLNLTVKFDHFYAILIFQLLLQKFFISDESKGTFKNSKDRPFFLLVGPQALNPYFSKKKLFNLNENFFKTLKNQSINYKLTHEDFSLERTD